MKNLKSLLAAALFACAGSAFAIDAPGSITTLPEQGCKTAYQLVTPRGTLYYDAAVETDYLTSNCQTGRNWNAGVTSLAKSDSRSQFLLFPAESEHTYFIYSVEAGKFIYQTGVRAGLTEDPTEIYVWAHGLSATKNQAYGAGAYNEADYPFTIASAYNAAPSSANQINSINVCMWDGGNPDYRWCETSGYDDGNEFAFVECEEAPAAVYEAAWTKVKEVLGIVDANPDQVAYESWYNLVMTDMKAVYNTYPEWPTVDVPGQKPANVTYAVCNYYYSVYMIFVSFGKDWKAVKDYYATYGTTIEANYAEALAIWQAYVDAPLVAEPEPEPVGDPLTWSPVVGGNTYAIVSVQPTGNNFYLDYVNENLTPVSAVDCTSLFEWPETAKFQAVALNDGRFAFKNIGTGKYLAWKGTANRTNTTGVNGNKGYTDEINEFSSWTMNESTRYEGAYWFRAEKRNDVAGDGDNMTGTPIISNGGDWNAWTTGEYLPSTGTAFSNSFGFYLLEEAEPEPEPVVPSYVEPVLKAEDVSAEVAYYIYTEARGGLTVVDAAATGIVGTAEAGVNQGIDPTDVRQQFAFVNWEGNLYLYNVATQKFFTGKNGGHGEFTDKPVDPILFKNEGNGTVMLYFDEAHNINLGGSKQVTIDSWKTKDAGNSFIIKVAEPFDQTPIFEFLAYHEWNGNVAYTEAPSDIDELLDFELEFEEARSVEEAPYGILGAIFDETGDAYAVVLGDRFTDVPFTAEEGKVTVHFTKIADIVADLQPAAKGIAQRALGLGGNTPAKAKVVICGKSFLVDGENVYSEVIVKNYNLDGTSGAVQTAIETISTTSDAVIYDLQGRRVSRVQNGVVIANGKKIVK